VRWRLRDEAVHRMVEETSGVLGELVRRGLLVRNATHSGAAIFSLDPARRDDAERFVREDDAGAAPCP